MSTPKKIETLLLEGNPYGLRYHDLANWTGRIFVATRASFSQLLKREELQSPGVYLLIGENEETSRLTAYIGEADVLSQRLPSHNQKDFWEEIVVCVAKDESLDKASVRYIESILIEKTHQDKLCDLENGVKPTQKSLSEANSAVMNEFIEKIVFMLSVLGYKIIRTSDTDHKENSPLLYCTQGDLKAKGRETDEGFVVYRGSDAKATKAPSWSSQSKKLRDTLVEKGVLMPSSQSKSLLTFSQDYVFSSPSAASGMVLGRSSNGRWEWKDKSGTPLKEIQEKLLTSN